MHKNIRQLIFGLTLLAACIVSAQAQNMNFLRKSPVGWMSDQDQAILKETIDAVLAAPNGTTTDWLNAQSGSHGRVQVIDEMQDLGTTCRHIRMRNEAAGRKGGGVYRLCRASDGSWRFAPNADDAPRYDDAAWE